MLIMIDMTKATAHFLVGGAIAFNQHLKIGDLKIGAEYIMTHNKNFDANEETNNQTPSAENIQDQADLTANEPQRQILKIMLVGSREVVRSAIMHFHLTRQADVGDWSRLEPNPNNPEEMISILIRKITVE